MDIHKRQKGFSLIEVIIAAGIISISIMYIAKAYRDFIVLSSSNTARVQAAFLLDEGVESIKTMRGYSWSTVASTTASTTYYMYWNTNRWVPTTTPQIIDGMFYRTLVFSPVYRDGSFNIASSGTVDSGSRKVDIAVTWSDRGSTSTRSMSMYIFNLFE